MIDFQETINHAIKGALEQLACDTAVNACKHVGLGWWNTYTTITKYDLWVNVASTHYTKLANHCMTFDLAGRTIDAALLEELHNEVTAWFTAIKEGVST